MAMQEQNRVTSSGATFGGGGGHHTAGEVEQQSEAYCDICQKELCNKYYLATHRRLKHFSPSLNTMISQDSMPQNVDLSVLFGIGEHNKALQNLYMNSQNMGNGGSPSPSSQPSSGAASTVANGENVAETPSKAPTPASADLNSMQNLLANIMPQLAQQNNVQQLLEQMGNMGAMNPLAFNPIAALQNQALLMSTSPTKGENRTEEENTLTERIAARTARRYFMKPKEQHKGGPPNPLNFGFPFNLAPSTSTASQQSVIVANDGEMTPPQKRSKTEDDDSKQHFENLLNSLTSGTATCLDCGKECDNPLELLQHRATEHDKKVMSPNAYPCNECDKAFTSLEYLQNHKMTQHTPLGQRILMGGPPVFPFLLPGMGQQAFPMMDLDPNGGLSLTPKHPGQPGMKRQYSSNGKNYCDLCNKEVCNKYFLRTHMLKMHGIVIDENKHVIGNVDTLEKERQGQLTFRCDQCHLELKTRQQLRQHKQDAHQIPPLPQTRITSSKPNLPQLAIVPPNAAFSSEEAKCPLCEKRLPGNQLALHMQSEHVGDVSSLLTGQIPSSPSLECRHCGHMSKDEQEQQSHQMTSHMTEYLVQQFKDSAAKSDPSILRCNQCQYSTKDQKNLEMHVERHKRMDEAKDNLGQDMDEDESLQMTTEVALQMAMANKFGEQVFKCAVCSHAYPDENSLLAHATVAHAGLDLTVPKKEADPEKVLERNSHTSGSLSPSSESLPEGYVKPEKTHVMQNFVLRISEPHGLFVGEFVAQLPVRSLVNGPAKLVVEAIPQ